MLVPDFPTKYPLRADRARSCSADARVCRMEHSAVRDVNSGSLICFCSVYSILAPRTRSGLDDIPFYAAQPQAEVCVILFCT